MKLGSLLELSPDALVVVERDGKIALLNRRAEAMFGYSRTELVGHSAEELVPERFRPEHTHPGCHCRLPLWDQEEGVGLELFGRRKDGTEFPAEISVSPLEADHQLYVVGAIREVSGCRRAQRSLRDSEERFRLLVDGVKDYAIFMLDPDGYVVSWNAGAARIKGYRADEIIGKHFSVFYPSEEIRRGKPAAMLRAAEQQGRAEDEGWRIRRDGSRFWASVVMTALRDEQGCLRGFAKVTRDVTERKRMQDVLRINEERFRLLAEHAEDVIYRYRLRPTQGFDYISPAVTALTGYRPGDFYANPNLYHNLVHPDDLPRVKPPEVLAAQRQPWMQNLRIIRRDGELRWTEEKCVPTLDRAGNVIAIEGIARDVTDRKQAELDRERLLRQVAEERTWLQAVIDRSPAGIVLIDGDSGHRLTANRYAQELFGQTFAAPDSMARYEAAILNPDGSPVSAEEMCPRRALGGEVITSLERQIRRPDGERVPVLASAGPINDDRGEILGAVVVFEDLRALKELERLREEWILLIAHDLRQPVTVIDGYANLLARQAEEIPGVVKPRINHIRSSAGRLQRMIGDLLDASRIESRQLALDRKPCDLAALIRQVSQQQMTTKPDHPIELALPEDLLMIEADAMRLEQVLANLLSNAAKYGYPKTAIRVSLVRHPDEVQVSVSNQGDGISPEALPNLFTRFGRTDAVERKRIEGIGLGLYITKGIVEAHGGRIWAESTPCETTTFHFTLPIPAG